MNDKGQYGVVFGAGSYDCCVNWFDTLQEAVDFSLDFSSRVDIVYRLSVKTVYDNPITGENVTIDNP